MTNKILIFAIKISACLHTYMEFSSHPYFQHTYTQEEKYLNSWKRKVHFQLWRIVSMLDYEK